MCLVSIIIPTFNREPELLKRSILSILYQSYKNFEILIIDDNYDIEYSNKIYYTIQKFNDERIIYVKNKNNIGGAKSRNKGIEIAKGKYISFLDDDDFYLKDKLEKQIDFLENNSFDFVISNLAILDTSYKVKDLRTFNWFKNNKYSNEELLVKHYKYHLTGTPTFMFKTNMIKDIGGFPNVEMGHEFHLVDIALRKNFKLGYMNEYFTIAIAHEGNRISTSNKRQKQLDNLLDYKFESELDLKTKDKKRILFRHYLAQTSDHLNQGRKIKAIKSAVDAFFNYPPAFIYETFKLVNIKINNKGDSK
ncbi:glycosyltransferase family 2 protein [Staphylococcus saprophyticus]|uniref:glycosyltransferase family 2 protein n=1 Tax=Staphylococcus saprophyticus TaxID=29385 RepID=UPI000853CC84|nr:glycosyltransferase family 2 protein [Staphylococcus saprophyticus]ASE57936.1 glycosyltransferase family 2 protein [Staphylococcus saprophyticus]MCM3120151.1 glycosyltransferase [Staphylococcus saprophyticus]MDW3878663.1 glycosyltransferase family 2 protein [Staphylococcus saprophyticus]MDW3921075.1 glycosyltransferase family 2 protein [Staphylococcus saprophyticus]MDW4019657.1 glycosyltransferase family 2 protein [Staphylococcus saprophyticus]